MADETYDEVIVDWDAADGDPDAIGFDDLAESEPDTSTPGLTVAWFDKHGSYGILHAPSRLAIAKGWGRREDAIAVADRLDGMLPWAATAAKLQAASREAVTDVAYVLSEGGGAFLTHPEVGGGSDA